jgi:hypothetical protein
VFRYMIRHFCFNQNSWYIYNGKRISSNLPGYNRFVISPISPQEKNIIMHSIYINILLGCYYFSASLFEYCMSYTTTILSFHLWLLLFFSYVQEKNENENEKFVILRFGFNHWLKDLESVSFFSITIKLRGNKL